MIKKFLRWLVLLIFSQDEKRKLVEDIVLKHFAEHDKASFINHIIYSYPIKEETKKIKQDLVSVALGVHVVKVIKQDLVLLAFSGDETKKFKEELLISAFNEVYKEDIEFENLKVKEGKYHNDIFLPANQIIFKNSNHFLQFGSQGEYKSHCNFDKEYQLCTLKIQLTKKSIIKLILGGDAYLHIPKNQYVDLMVFCFNIGLTEDEIFSPTKGLINIPNPVL